MAIRATLSHVARQAQMSMSRATVREFDDEHLIQEVKYADVYHSETPSNFERWQPVGFTAFPIKQQEDENKSSSTAQQDDVQGDWNHDQPKGPAAEAVMLYLNGQRSHPIAMVDDSRVRPYSMSEGEGAHYAPDGSEQMVYFKENGTYIVSLDNVSVKDKKNKKTRFVSLRHVTKKMQTHKIDSSSSDGGSSGGSSGSASPQSQARSSGGGSGTDDGTIPTNGGSSSASGQQQKYKHEGDSVNTEIRCTADRIEFRTGDTVVGYYEKSSETWYFKGKIAQMEFTDKISEKVGSSEVEILPSAINADASTVSLSKATYIGQDAKGGKEGPQVETVGGPAAQAFAKL